MGKRPGSEFEKREAGNHVIDSYRLQLQSIAVKGFISNQTELKLNDKNGIGIAIGADSSRFIVYEIAIPLKELMTGNSVQLDELITLNVSVNAMDRPTGSSGDRGGRAGRGGGGSRSEMTDMGGSRQGGGMGGGQSGGGRRGMGGGRPGGMSRDGGGSGSDDRSGLSERATFKQKFTLSKD